MSESPVLTILGVIVAAGVFVLAILNLTRARTAVLAKRSDVARRRDERLPLQLELLVKRLVEAQKDVRIFTLDGRFDDYASHETFNRMVVAANRSSVQDALEYERRFEPLEWALFLYLVVEAWLHQRAWEQGLTPFSWRLLRRRVFAEVMTPPEFMPAGFERWREHERSLDERLHPAEEGWVPRHRGEL